MPARPALGCLARQGGRAGSPGPAAPRASPGRMRMAGEPPSPAEEPAANGCDPGKDPRLPAGPRRDTVSTRRSARGGPACSRPAPRGCSGRGSVPCPASPRAPARAGAARPPAPGSVPHSRGRSWQQLPGPGSGIHPPHAQSCPALPAPLAPVHGRAAEHPQHGLPLLRTGTGNSALETGGTFLRRLTKPFPPPAWNWVSDPHRGL